MQHNITVYRQHFQELWSFSQDRNTLLQETANGQPTFSCLPKPKGICRIFGGSETGREAADRVYTFVREFQDWFVPDHYSKEVLFTLSREFPGRIARACQRILERLDLGRGYAYAQRFTEAQDICLTLDGPHGIVEAWVHSKALAASREVAIQELMDAGGMPTEEGCYLPGVSTASLRVFLDLCYAEKPKLPPNPYELLALFRDVEVYEPLSPLPDLRQHCERALLESMDRYLFFELVQCVTDWRSPIADLVVLYTCRHFGTLQKDKSLGQLPPELIARVLDSDYLIGPEQKNLRTLLHWASRRSWDYIPDDPTYWLTEPFFEGKGLIEFIRFDQLTLENFVTMVAQLGILPQDQCNEWVRRLASGSTPVEEVRPRNTMMLSSYDHGKLMHLHWHAPGLDSPLPQESPPFCFAGATWCIQLDQHWKGGLQIQLIRIPSFEEAPESRIEARYRFPLGGDRISGRQRIDDDTMEAVCLNSSFDLWKDRYESADQYLPIELELEII